MINICVARTATFAGFTSPSELEAAAVHCAHLTDLHKLQPNQNFMVCDAGGSTVVCDLPTPSQLFSLTVTNDGACVVSILDPFLCLPGAWNISVSLPILMRF